MTLLDSLPHTATATRRVRTKGGLGGTTDTFTTLFTARACWRQTAGERLINEFAKRGIAVTNKVYFTADPALDERDILTIGGQAYEVRTVADPDASAGLGVLFRIMVERSTTGGTES